MISKQTFDSYPEFGNSSTKTAPDSAKYSAGFQQSDVLPAEWMNWAWSHNTKGITDLNTGLSSVEDELNNLVTAGGETPSESDSQQVKKAVNYLINLVTGSLSSLTTSVKTTLVAAINSHLADTNNPHSVTGTQLSGPVPTANIADSAVTTDKINDGAVTLAKMNSSAFDASIESGSSNIPTSAAVAAAIALLVPTGTVHSYLGTVAPDGYLLCNGQAVSRSTYSTLYALIGTTYGTGDGETTFNLPDLRESVLVGAGQNALRTIVSHDVYEVGEFKDDQAQGHKHTHTRLYQAGAGLSYRDGPYYFTAGTYTTSSPTNDGTNGVPRTGSTTHGKQTGVNFIIKY